MRYNGSRFMKLIKGMPHSCETGNSSGVTTQLSSSSSLLVPELHEALKQAIKEHAVEWKIRILRIPQQMEGEDDRRQRGGGGHSYASRGQGKRKFQTFQKRPSL